MKYKHLWMVILAASISAFTSGCKKEPEQLGVKIIPVGMSNHYKPGVIRWRPVYQPECGNREFIQVELYSELRNEVENAGWTAFVIITRFQSEQDAWNFCRKVNGHLLYIREGVFNRKRSLNSRIHSWFPGPFDVAFGDYIGFKGVRYRIIKVNNPELNLRIGDNIVLDNIKQHSTVHIRDGGDVLDDYKTVEGFKRHVEFGVSLSTHN